MASGMARSHRGFAGTVQVLSTTRTATPPGVASRSCASGTVDSSRAPQLLVADVGISWKRPSGTSRRRRCSRRSSSTVGVGGIAARLELPEPDEPRHAGVGRLFEQMLEVSPKPGRNPLGDARFDPALRVHQRVNAEPLDRTA